MVHKKKYYIFSLVLLFGMLFATFSTIYADSSELTPINNLDTDMVNLIIKYLKDNNSYNYINSTCANNFNSFYNSKTDEAIQNFCNKWNSIDFSNFVETLEQCVFIIDTYNNLPMVSVYFNNNGLGNKALHYQLNYSSNSYNSFYRNDNGNTITNKRLSFYFNASGTISYDGLYDVGATNGRTINLNSPTLTMIDSSNFESKVMFAFYKQSIYFRNNSSAFNWVFLNGNSILQIKKEEPDIPINPSNTGTITNPSGEVTGNIDLTGIEQGIGHVNNNLNNIENKIPTSGDMQNVLSGEVGKITSTLTNQPNLNDTTINSGDIEASLGFDFMADPYANFWYELTNGLRGSLTGSVRQIPVNWLGYQGVFDLDKLGFNYPASVRLILTSASTVSMVWVLVKWWKIIVDKLTSGNMDEVLAMNEEERYC